MQNDSRLKYLFSKNLNYLLQGHDITKYRLAHDIGKSEATVGNWCKSETMPYKDVQTDVANYFNISMDELLGEDFPPLREIKKPVPQTEDGKKELMNSVWNALSPSGRDWLLEYAAFLIDRERNQESGLEAQE